MFMGSLGSQSTINIKRVKIMNIKEYENFSLVKINKLSLYILEIK